MFRGIYTPCTTLLTEDGGIDYDAQAVQIDRLVDAGVNGILFFGSIGEFFAFTPEEKREFAKFAVEKVAGRTQVLMGIGGTIQDEAIAFGKYAKELGADASVLISPYYFGPTEAAAERYFANVVEAIDMPTILYNFPARTGSDLTPELVGRLARDHAQIVGVKDTVDTISHTRKILAAVAPREDFSVLSGFDEYYTPNRIAGGQGVLCGLTNVVPELFVAMDQAWESGDRAGATAKAETINGLMRIYDVCDLFIAAVKEAERLRGVPCTSVMREPYMPVTSEQSEQIKEILADAGVL